MIVDIPGATLDENTRLFLQKYRFKGICLFRRNVQSPEQLHQLMADLREVLGEDALIAIDQEGGAVIRILDTPQAPSAMALGATANPEISRQVGAAVGRGLRSYGINWNYAPSLDVNVNPLNPMIGDRSFGSDPESVALHGVNWALGLEEAGVLSSVKHFPGHGDTHIDTHLALPTVNKPLEELLATELHPFKKAAEAGVGSMMTAHIIFPALDPENPATLSEKILGGLLRDSWGYDGLIVTDAMDMHAISRQYEGGKAAIKALNAGADLVLCVNDAALQEQQVEAIAQAIEDGSLNAELLARSEARLARFSVRFPCIPVPYSEAQQTEDDALMLTASRLALTEHRIEHLPDTQEPTLLLCPENLSVGGAYEDTLSPSHLQERLQEVFPSLTLLTYPQHDALQVLPQLQQALQDTQQVLLGGLARELFTPEEQQLVATVQQQNLPILHLALWNPYQVMQLDLPALITYGFRDNALQALQEALQGKNPTGKLPVRF
ncbi:hypothetical protein GCM10008938_08910 [Deinococcus roseus]|uniref:Glycoside hydrolase family 3 N-terminal domain-containing protein n=2 Tax=Deinococcus roseus TaxID=392414 RepID=A0ABQ2CZG8_9DEIO|nr:hypothetical protein GCM10008938_08910 [Deinococcus roseus]